MKSAFVFLLMLSLPLLAQENNLQLATESTSVIPAKMSYQGLLTDNNGAPQNGTFTMTFGLFTTATGGNALWSETQNAVAVTNGIFNVLLGSVNPINLAFDVTYYLNVSVQGTNLLPRIELASSSYSFNTARIQGIPVSSTTPSTGQVLKYSGGQWIPGTDETTGGTAGGDLTGMYPNPTVAALQGRTVSASAPTSGQALKWTGSQWVPSSDTGVDDHGKLNGLDGDDHEQYLLVSRSDFISEFTGRLDIRQSGIQRLMDFRNDNGTRLGWIRNVDGHLQLSADEFLLISSEGGVLVKNKSNSEFRPISASAFNVSSSRAFKTDINYLTEGDCEQALTNIANMKPATYKLKSDSNDKPISGDSRRLGLIAEEIPSELLGTRGETVDLYALTTSLTAAIKALKAQVDQQSQTIQQLQRQLAGLPGEHPFNGQATHLNDQEEE